MTSAALQHDYRYAHASAMSVDGPRSRLRLATSGGISEQPHFFEGRLLEPRHSALALRALSRVVSERFYVPPSMLERILRQNDPVVTSGGGLLRLEGFSSCCSAYARVDLEPAALDGDVAGHGTTNVDFNASMRAALAQVTDAEQLALSVGTDAVTLRRGGAEVVERRVALPIRWLKGFVEVQAYQSRMEPRARLDRAGLLAFLRSLPASASGRTQLWAVPAGRGLRMAGAPVPGALRITGVARLRVLEALAPFARELIVHATPDGEAVEWQLRLGSVRFHLTTTAEVSRGFSGEGQVLVALARGMGEDLVADVRSRLRWQAALRAEDLQGEVGAPGDAVSAALAALGTRGLVGFDVAEAAYFHREMPFDMALVEDLHPRLVAARQLVADGRVLMLRSEGENADAEVGGSDVTHRVELTRTGSTCTCPWHAKHGNSRGECKHALAVRLLLRPEG